MRSRIADIRPAVIRAFTASRRACLSEPPMSETARSAESSTRPMPTKPWIIPPKET